MKKRIVDKEGYVVEVCRICSRMFATHPMLYRAKYEKDICMDCFILNYRKPEVNK